MKKLVVMLLAMLVFVTFAGEVAVTSVTAQQRYPWNGLVDIAVAIKGTAEDAVATECLFVATNSATKAAIPIEHITRNGEDVVSSGVVTRKFIWDAAADVGEVKIDDIALTVGVKPLGGVQLWENGPYWAEYNVGAAKPEECGYYFWWGDTVGYKRNANDNGWVSAANGTPFSFSTDNCPTYGKDNFQLQSMGYIDAAGNLVAEYDAATAHLGAPWRMPTDAEFSALINNCDTEWTSRNGVSGRLVKGRGAYASKSIFLPAACFGISDFFQYSLGSGGDYWSSSRHPSNSFFAQRLDFDSSSFCRDSLQRDCGQTVRPVRGFDEARGSVIASDSAVTTHFALDTRTETDTTIKFDGTMYGWWAEDGEGEIWGYYGDYGVDPESADWADDFVNVGGNKEPGTWDGYAFPVTITPGTTFTPQIVEAPTDANFATVSMKTDAEMRTMMRNLTDEEYWAEWWVDQIWPNGQTDSSRAWVVVLVTDVPKGNLCYTFDLTTKPIVDGSKSVKAYAQQYGATLPDTLEIPKSIPFKVGIKETGEVFPERLWALYDPANNAQYRAAIDKVDDNGGDSEMFDTVGLWLVTQEMIDEQQGGDGPEPPMSGPTVVEPVQAFVAPTTKTMMQGVVLAADGSVVGIAQLNLGKASKKGESKVTVAVYGIDGKKAKSKAVPVATSAGLQRVTFNVKGYGPLTLDIGSDGFVGGAAGATVVSVKNDVVTGDAVTQFSFANGYAVNGLLAEYLPNGVKVARTAKKWKSQKAGKLKYVKANAKKGIVAHLEEKGENIAGLKLTYTAKTGVLKGSFRLWTLDEVKGKLKSVLAKVTGVVINGVGYCEATVKKQKIGNLIVK